MTWTADHNRNEDLDGDVERVLQGSGVVGRRPSDTALGSCFFKASLSSAPCYGI
jgi:hypothetical protein